MEEEVKPTGDTSDRLGFGSTYSPNVGKSLEDPGPSIGLSPVRFPEFGASANRGLSRSLLSCHQLARRMESPAILGSRSHEHLANLSSLTQGARGFRMFNNPNKAWAIVCNVNGQVLVANSIFRQLLDLHSTESDIRLWDYIERKSKDGQETLRQLEIDEETGDTKSYNGQVVNLITGDDTRTAVSLTTKPVASSSRQLVFLEPVHKTVGHIDLDSTGLITNMDDEAESIFQQKVNSVLGQHIQTLIPGIILPGELPGSYLKEACTGKTEDDLHFPLSVILRREELGSAAEYSPSLVPSIAVTVWVYSSLSGLIILDEHGEIVECDQGLSSLVLGYPEAELVRQRIEKILPGFYDDFDLPSCDRTEEDLGCEELCDVPEHSDNKIAEDTSCPPDDSSPLEEICINIQDCQINTPPHQRNVAERPPSTTHKEKENLVGSRSPVFKKPSSKTPVKIPMDVFTSTPAHGSLDLSSPARSSVTHTPQSSNRKPRMRAEQSLERSRKRFKERNLFGDSRSFEDGSVTLPTGCFFGLARHKNGTEISTLYQIKKVSLRTGETVYCVWVSRDSDDIAGKTQNHLTLGTTMPDDPYSGKYGEDSTLENGELSFRSLVDGSYNEQYSTLDQIGKGAYGCVRSAFRHSDNLLVVVKFIYKKKVSHDNWVKDNDGQLIPFEASLLSALDHPNIVRILQVFQNSSVVQMVMEKHGDMDLFEFIDRNPVMDETLASYIFKQIVEGVDFLHSKEILHRDIKDENVIIDHKFRIRIIDFGSATFFKPGDRFNTFYGTVEYCAPEVLKGNLYDGPQVEIWALGILLYILMYGENPFYNVADTVRAELHPPHGEVSSEVWNMIEGILDPNPSTRATLMFIKEHAWLNQECPLHEYALQDVIPCSEQEINPVYYYTEPLAAPPPPPYSNQASSNEDILTNTEDSTDEALLTGIRETQRSLSSTDFQRTGLSSFTSEDQSVHSVSEFADMSAD